MFQTTPKLAELSYKLLYKMSANRDTSTPTLRYLRTTRDFLFQHLSHVPFAPVTQEVREGCFLVHQSWLLKAVALELKLNAANKQRSHAQRLLTLLLDDNPAPKQAGSHLTLRHVTSRHPPSLNVSDVASLSCVAQCVSSSSPILQRCNFLLRKPH